MNITLTILTTDHDEMMKRNVLCKLSWQKLLETFLKTTRHVHNVPWVDWFFYSIKNGILKFHSFTLVKQLMHNPNSKEVTMTRNNLKKQRILSNSRRVSPSQKRKREIWKIIALHIERKLVLIKNQNKT